MDLLNMQERAEKFSKLIALSDAIRRAHERVRSEPSYTNAYNLQCLQRQRGELQSLLRPVAVT